MQRLWGYPDQEGLLGRSLFELWKTADEPAVALAQLTEKKIEKVEAPATRVDGSGFYLGLTAEAVCDANGALTQVLVTFSDITDRKRLEGQLMQAQKMESIGRLAGGIAHDFNNLLTVISAGLDLGMAPLAPEHPSRARLADVADAAQSAAALTRHLLAFSRKEIIAPKVLDLNEVIRRTEKMILRLIGEDIELRAICGENVTPIRFDPGQVEQILVNLAVNARDAMPAGGRLTIATSNLWVDDPQTARDGGARPGEYAVLAVSDNGAGMSEEVRAHLFEPFFTTKGPGQGTGLGLAMVYGAVQQNGGRIEVYSEPDQGTTFKIYLPAAKGIAGATARPPGRRCRPAQRHDSSSWRTTRACVASPTTRSPAWATWFTRSRAAPMRCAALPSLSPAPELLITDVIMPGMNGRVLAERVTAAASEHPRPVRLGLRREHHRRPRRPEERHRVPRQALFPRAAVAARPRGPRCRSPAITACRWPHPRAAFSSGFSQ